MDDHTWLPRAELDFQQKLIHQDYQLLSYADDYVKAMVIKSILRNQDNLVALELEHVRNESLRQIVLNHDFFSYNLTPESLKIEAMIQDNSLFELAKDHLKEEFFRKVFEEEKLDGVSENLKIKVIDYH